MHLEIRMGGRWPLQPNQLWDMMTGKISYLLFWHNSRAIALWTREANHVLLTILTLPQGRVRHVPLGTGKIGKGRRWGKGLFSPVLLCSFQPELIQKSTYFCWSPNPFQAQSCSNLRLQNSRSKNREGKNLEASLLGGMSKPDTLQPNPYLLPHYGYPSVTYPMNWPSSSR